MSLSRREVVALAAGALGGKAVALVSTGFLEPFPRVSVSNGDGLVEYLEAELEELEEEAEDLRSTIDDLSAVDPVPAGDVSAAVELSDDLMGGVAAFHSGGGSGTAFHYGDGRYVTALHVAGGGPSTWSIELLDGRSTGAGRLDSDRGLDSLIVGTSLAPDVSADAGSVDDLRPGDTVFSIGHPFGVGWWVISVGAYVGDSVPGAGPNRHFADYPLDQGSSGAPVFDLDGRVVGMTVERFPRDGVEETAPDEPFLSFEPRRPHASFVPIDDYAGRFGVD